MGQTHNLRKTRPKYLMNDITRCSHDYSTTVKILGQELVGEIGNNQASQPSAATTTTATTGSLSLFNFTCCLVVSPSKTTTILFKLNVMNCLIWRFLSLHFPILSIKYLVFQGVQEKKENSLNGLNHFQNVKKSNAHLKLSC